ncbi:glycosyltransferase family 4 protein [Candidatus Woesearchaeota archaeon]|nr:glycosyltransferase family 4 protein [Candidatus Woesearchaeota archaeon]
MNILIASTYLPPFAGGAERIAFDLAKGINEKENVKLITTSKNTEYYNNKIIKVKYTKGLTLFYSTLAYPYIKKLIKNENIELIHTHMTLPWGYVFRNIKVKKLITCHGSDVYPEKNFFINKLINDTFKKTDVIVSPSIWLSKYINEEYNYSSRIIPNGINTRLFRPLKIESNEKVVLFVGRFIELKGINLILKVASILKDYEFWFVGNGPLSKKINLPNTKILGFKNKEDLVELYNKATICLFPSQRENFPLVGLEAMSSGCPVITTKLGFSEYINDMENGLLINYDKGELLNKISLLMEDYQLRKNIKKNARKTAVKFDKQIMINKYYSLYKEII